MNQPSMLPDHNEHCSDHELKALLFDDPSSAVYSTAAAHLERCEACRTSLEKLAADEPSWRELPMVFDATIAAEAGHAVGTEGGPSPSVGALANSPSTNRFAFLESPNHPELLGRLGRYDIESFLGSGGMGIVFKGFDRELNRPVAIKCLAPYLAHNATARHRFAREGRAAAAVVHENVVAIHNVESNHNIPFIVMQFVPGATVQSRVEQYGPLPMETMLRIALHAARGLEAAHAQGVIHRDIKPGNILLEDNCDRAMLTDFGLARVADDASLTQSGIVSGTPNFMSPEQAHGDLVDERSDLFSLGAVLYFMATGFPPFNAERMMSVLHRVCHEPHKPLGQIRPELPWDFIDLVDKLLRKRPSRRFQDARSVAEAATSMLSKLQQPKSDSMVAKLIRNQAHLSRRAARWVRQHPKTVQALFAALGIGLLISLYPMLPWVTSPTPNSSQTVANQNTARTNSGAPQTYRPDIGAMRQALVGLTPTPELEHMVQEARATIVEIEQSWTASRLLQGSQDAWMAEAALLDQQLRSMDLMPDTSDTETPIAPSEPQG